MQNQHLVSQSVGNTAQEGQWVLGMSGKVLDPSHLADLQLWERSHHLWLFA